jgi:glycosyltransferase involved in cell wall biosynthesis
VLLVTHFFSDHGGGVEMVAGELAQRLAATGAVRITWFASDTDPAPSGRGLSCYPVRAWNGFERRLEVPLPIWTPFALWPLWRAVGASDVVHVHDVIYPGNALACVLAAIRRKPVVVTQHIGPVPYRNRVLRLAVSAANATIVAGLLARARRVIFISAAVQRYFERRLRRRGELVPNGVDTTLFRLSTAEERSTARRALGIRPDARVVTYVGRFVDKKGLPLLRNLARRAPDVGWCFAGSGPSNPETWRLPNVAVVRGRKREGIRELLWASDLLVLPSESEGFPLVVQEALACGVACLVTSEIVEGFPPVHDVVWDEPLGPGSEDRWAARIHRLLEDPELRAKSAERAEFTRIHWSWERVVEHYLAVFSMLAASPAA